MTARIYQLFKWLRINALAVVLLSLTATPAFAATLQLYSIGNSVVTGKTFTTFTHTGENPTFTGSASANTQINIALNAATNKVTSDDSGAWVFTPTTLLAGAHDVVISAGTETKSFTLTIASVSATVTPTIAPTKAATVSTPTTLPVSGGESLTWMMVLAGVMMLGLGMMGWSVAASAAPVETMEEHD
jgi:hypothetical protein